VVDEDCALEQGQECCLAFAQGLLVRRCVECINNHRVRQTEKLHVSFHYETY
jgi:hypothetical protein